MYDLVAQMCNLSSHVCVLPGAVSNFPLKNDEVHPKAAAKEGCMSRREIAKFKFVVIRHCSQSGDT